jgi:hypothetical protein
MKSRIENPFETIESAHDWLALLSENVAEAQQELDLDIQRESGTNTSRRLDALRMARYNLEKLELHLSRSTRILNDLRTLRRLLFEERESKPAVKIPEKRNVEPFVPRTPDSLPLPIIRSSRAMDNSRRLARAVND